MPTEFEETYMFEIYYSNTLVVRELFKSLEEAAARITKWPWPYNIDNCAISLWKKVDVFYIGFVPNGF